MKGINFVVSKNLLETNSLLSVLVKIRCLSESYLRQVKAMVVDYFVRSVWHQSKNLPKNYEMLFTGSEVPTGPTELSQVQRDKRKLGTMCHALIAEHMFSSNLDTYTGDDAIIDTFTREDSARATRSNSRGDMLLLNRKKAEWKRHLATVRSALNQRNFSLVYSRSEHHWSSARFRAGVPLAYPTESNSRGVVWLIPSMEISS